jgi:hypothetical protein
VRGRSREAASCLQQPPALRPHACLLVDRARAELREKPRYKVAIAAVPMTRPDTTPMTMKTTIETTTTVTV